MNLFCFPTPVSDLDLLPGRTALIVNFSVIGLYNYYYERITQFCFQFTKNEITFHSLTSLRNAAYQVSWGLFRVYEMKICFNVKFNAPMLALSKFLLLYKPVTLPMASFVLVVYQISHICDRKLSLCNSWLGLIIIHCKRLPRWWTESGVIHRDISLILCYYQDKSGIKWIWYVKS